MTKHFEWNASQMKSKIDKESQKNDGEYNPDEQFEFSSPNKSQSPIKSL